MHPRQGDVVLREVPYDHPDVVALTEAAQGYYVDLYGGADTNPLTAAEFAPPDGRFLVGYLRDPGDGRVPGNGSDHPVAMGGWRLAEHAPLPARRPAEIRRMYVHPEVRGRGLGRQLLAALEDGARAAGADLMVLETGRPQVEAVALYRSAGYVEVPAFGYWADSSEAVHLGKRLATG